VQVDAIRQFTATDYIGQVSARDTWHDRGRGGAAGLAPCDCKAPALWLGSAPLLASAPLSVELCATSATIAALMLLSLQQVSSAPSSPEATTNAPLAGGESPTRACQQQPRAALPQQPAAVLPPQPQQQQQLVTEQSLQPPQPQPQVGSQAEAQGVSAHPELSEEYDQEDLDADWKVGCPVLGSGQGGRDKWGWRDEVGAARAGACLQARARAAALHIMANLPHALHPRTRRPHRRCWATSTAAWWWRARRLWTRESALWRSRSCSWPLPHGVLTQPWWAAGDWGPGGDTLARRERRARTTRAPNP
jgi:hypothetical protein